MSQYRSVKMFSPKKSIQEKYYSRRKIKILHKVHYTIEEMLKLLITYIKLPEGIFPITIYIPFYLMVRNWSIHQTNSAKLSNWFDP